MTYRNSSRVRACCVLMIAWGIVSVAAGAGLDDTLFLPRDSRSLRVSSSDPDWKAGNADYRPILPGQTLVVADIDGPGIIRHIWFTIAAKDPRYGRSLTLRMYWDNQEQPAVESPLGDFFAVGHGSRRDVDSLPVAVSSEGRAYNCYWPMPFRKHARITLTNDSKQHKVTNTYFYVDYEKPQQVPDGAAYFHAQYRQEFPAQSGRNYLILDAAGSGQYVGTVLSAYYRTQGWFGEGDDFFYIDGDTEPTLRGTGTEDYFCDAWGFREFLRPYYGVVQYDGAGIGNRVSVYRWHVPDPVIFKKSLRVEIEHKGVMRDVNGKRVSGFEERADLFSSVAFWYQTGVARRYTELPPAEQRVVPQTVVSFEDREADVKVSNNIKAQPNRGGIEVPSTECNVTVTVPFELAKAVSGVPRVQLGGLPEGAIWKVQLDDKLADAGGLVDTYATNLALREARFEIQDLAAGKHTLTFTCSGRNPHAHSYWLRLEAFAVDEITAYAAPAK